VTVAKPIDDVPRGILFMIGAPVLFALSNAATRVPGGTAWLMAEQVSVSSRAPDRSIAAA